MNFPHSSAVQRIQRWHIKARVYVESDPEVALMFARKTAEAVCKILFADKISENTPTGLDKLLDQLVNQKQISEHLVPHLRTIQTHGNFGSHDQGDESDHISADYVEPCIKSLSLICKWLLGTYLGGQNKTVTLPKEQKKDAAEKHCYLKPPVTIKDLGEALGVPSFMLVDMLKSWEIITREDSEVSPEIAERVCKHYKWKFQKGPVDLRSLGL